MIDLNNEDQVNATIDEACALWTRQGNITRVPQLSLVHAFIDLLRSDWKPEDWRLVKAREIAAEQLCLDESRERALQGKFDGGSIVQSALAAIRWCEEQGFKKP